MKELNKYVNRLSDIQERLLDDYSIKSLLKAEIELSSIMLDALVDYNLTNDNMYELWERWENMHLDINSKYHSFD